MSNNYLKNVLDPAQTPQREPLPGTNQVENSAGGYAFAVDNFMRLQRFLILGSEGGSYYAGERKLTTENLTAVQAAIAEDGLRVVRAVVEVSRSGRSPKNDPALFVLALCSAAIDPATRAAAFAALPHVARIGTHLMHYAEYVNALRGWGKGLRNAVAAWYVERTPESLARDVVKYRERDGWSHDDLLRLSHPKTADPTQNAILHYVTHGWGSVGETPHDNPALLPIWAAERARDADEGELVRLIQTYGLPMECLPTDKRTAAVYEALIPTAGITWLIRNLGNLSKAGVLATGRYSALDAVTARLTDRESLRKGRVHPLGVLVAMKTYASGKSVRGSGEWEVVSKVVEALDTAFYLAFDAIEPTGKRYVLGLDVSGSMSIGELAGMPGITPRIGTAAMAMVTNRTESKVATMAFSQTFQKFDLSRQERLDSVIERMNAMPFGRTDCAQPMLWAAENRVEADAFVIYTDSETWFGDVHPTVALQRYREKMGIPARLIVVGMVSSNFTIADPNDPGMLDLVGFSTDAPAVMSEFVLGRI